MQEINGRRADHDIDSVFLLRWSPRAFTGEAMPQEDLLRLFEAARWAPSASNRQPWRFVYAHRGTQAFKTILDTLDEGNRRWTPNASVLAVILSKTHNRTATGEMRPAYTHAFDTGASWSALALQATLTGYHVHAMAGIDRDKAVSDLKVPEGYRVEAGLAIGRIASKDTLPDDLQAREVPSQRNPVSSFAFEGVFRPD
ncbi:nitroreductase family protein [Mycoplana rhizolycopersici]|uniref:Nitroreductase family protein n=1 Tax=Mycoplana rhizolycopersici TaxID=2746702 RepID=A0ABX2Q8M8_9HYPH|nr:nitroreductase family protein [Rhizobium rhizolycopersici]NVP54066.1 nitroreductase family protein [Rhizobium rhizolycopersici]